MQVQILVILIGSLFTIYQTLITSINYQNSMNHIAYGYNNSILINNNIPGNYLDLTSRNTRLYYGMNYIERDLFFNDT